MAKKCSSYTLPLFSILLILFCDACFLAVNLFADNSHSIADYAQAAVYNFLTIMALWSHLATLLANPGYVPKGYHEYN